MKTKRFAALFLTLAMLLGISPISVFASGGNGGSGGDDDGDSPQISLISAFVEPDVIEIAIGDERTEAEIKDSFPDAVSATVNGTEGESVPVTEWSLVYAGTADGAFSTAAQAEFYYEPTLAAGYTLSGEAILPSQKVQVGEALSHEPALASLTGSDFVVTGDASNYTWNDTTKVLTITGSGALEISMASGVTVTTTDTIVVQNDGASANAANITLNGVNIDVSASPSACAFDIQGNAMANITLQGTNTLQGGMQSAGLQVQARDGATATLNLSGNGTLTARGGEGAAGIGGGVSNSLPPSYGAGGNINISGGTVTAQGGAGGAGIGGSKGGSGGKIEISGNATVSATGNAGGAGIGGGSFTTQFDVAIVGSGGTITIGGSAQITLAQGDAGGAGIGGGQYGHGGTIKILEDAEITRAQGGTAAAGIGGGNGDSGGYSISDAGAGGNITISGNAKILLAQGSDGGAGIGGGKGTGASDTGAGGIIQISDNSAVTANGGAGNSGGAGIGGGRHGVGGNITISGGTVSATGGYGSAGVGGGSSGAGGTIAISGGTLTAQGGKYGAGIGGGQFNAGGTITISGGIVSATSTSGGAGIGGGAGSNGDGGNITITDNAVITKAQGSHDSFNLSVRGGAGIGGGASGNGGNITISGNAQILSAQGGDNAAGIGGGYARAGGTITISGGTVASALGGAGAAGIGDGNFYTGSTLGTFSTSAPGEAAGTAFIMASSISDNDDTSGWSGVIFGGDAGNPNHGYFYGTNADFTLKANAELPQGKTLVIPSGKTFSINTSATLTNKGTIYKLGTLNHGTPTYGTLDNQGLILPENNVTDPGFSLTVTPVYLRENSGDKQYSLDGTNWFSYTGKITLTGTTTQNSVQVQSGEHDIILTDLHINRGGSLARSAFDVDGSAVANITLRETNTLIGSSHAAGLQVEGSATLNITSESSGFLSAAGGSQGAGIGGGSNGDGGIITISGGTVTATGGSQGAGIGGGNSGTGGTVKITGGTVTATGGKTTGDSASGGRGIGGGQGNGTAGGTLEISGGTVTATGGNALGAAFTPAFSAKPIISVPENQMVKVDIMAGDASPGTAVFPSTDYHTNIYVKLTIIDVQQPSITLGNTLTYNGTQQTQSVQATFGGSAMSENSNYTLSGNTATNVGDYTLTLTGAGNYIGSLTKTYSIAPLSLAGAQVTLGAPLVANDTQQTQGVASVMLGGLTLAEGTDYTLSANTATDAGSYTLTLTGKGNYSGTLAVPFTVFETTEEALPYEPNGTLDLEDSLVPSGNTLHINPQSSVQQSQDLAKLREFAQQNGITGEVHFLADITMTDANGGEVQPQDGNTRIRINVPGLTTADTVTVLHIKDDGSVEEITPVYVYNGYVEFFPTSFSVYSVIVHKAGSSTGTTTALSPQTGVYA